MLAKWCPCFLSNEFISTWLLANQFQIHLWELEVRTAASFEGTYFISNKQALVDGSDHSGEGSALASVPLLWGFSSRGTWPLFLLRDSGFHINSAPQRLEEPWVLWRMLVSSQDNYEHLSDRCTQKIAVLHQQEPGEDGWGWSWGMLDSWVVEKGSHHRSIQ